MTSESGFEEDKVCKIGAQNRLPQVMTVSTSYSCVYLEQNKNDENRGQKMSL